ncbi:sporulation protein YqfD [Anaerobacillus sp. MEB173]|uniref:sporulation protein YqfD n=1 Tax=Anaerobacillus sp. MEB173 TaxID=3383345 RepID=UPI003F8F6115
MKNLWATTFVGYVRMKIEGSYAELFLNRCIEHELSIWHIKRISDKHIICYISLDDAKKVRPLLRETNCKVSFIERRGFPFFIRRLLLRIGFVGGVVAFIAILFILSNMVWGIKIDGANPKVEYELEQIVSEMGIKRGKFHFLLPSVEDIQREVTNRLEDATWVGVTLNGTTFHFQVVEQKLPEKQELLSPRHLVAKKKAIIHEIFVEHGQTQVSVNDFVNKGDLLVSGFIGKEGKTEIVPAKAKVLGEIWYKSTVDIPFVNDFSTFTGNTKTRYYLNIFNINIPIWGFGKIEFEEYEINQDIRSLQFLKWSLPLAFEKRKWLENEIVTREYSKDEAVKIGKEMAKKELIKNLEEDSSIHSEKVLHEEVENGKVKLIIHYKVIEDITEEQPIIQGD